jgi:hypothetical protein
MPAVQTDTVSLDPTDGPGSKSSVKKNIVPAAQEVDPDEDEVPKNKGKGKATEVDDGMDEDEDEGEDDSGDENGEVSLDDADEETYEEIDPANIIAPGSRRSTRSRIDYSSKEAQAKLGDVEDDDEEEGEFSF